MDVVDVTDLNGNLLASGVPCVNQSVQGVVVSGFPGNNTYVVTGWRFGQPLPLYRGQVTIHGGERRADYFGTVFAAGIPDPLTVDAILADANAPLGYPTCGAGRDPGVDAGSRTGWEAWSGGARSQCGPAT